MAVNKKFEAYKVSREVKRNGETYLFERPKKNEFQEITKETDSIGSIKALYHEENAYIQLFGTDANLSRNKKIPMLLCVMDELNGLELNGTQGLKVKDIVRIGTKTYSVNGIRDIQNWGIIADISLDVLDEGE